MKRDTLLLITTSYPEIEDGSEAAGSFVSDVARELGRRLPVRVLAPGRVAGSVASDGDVSVRRFASPGLPLSLLSARRPDHWPMIVRTLASLRSQALLSNADRQVIHTLALWALPSGWAAAVLKRKHAVPFSIWALGSDIWNLGRMPIVRDVLRRVIDQAEHRYADGLQLAEDAERIGKRPFVFLPSTRSLAATHGRTPASKPPYRLLFLGRWHPNKGIDLLVDALRVLSDNAWRRIAEVRIAGGGPLEIMVRHSVADLQAAGRPVHLEGYLNREAAAAAIAAADWLVIPSRIESIPVVFSDALKMGRPVISSPVGDMPALVAANPPCGIVTTSASVEGIRAAIELAVHETPTAYAAGVARCAAMFDLGKVVSRIASDTMPESRNWKHAE